MRAAFPTIHPDARLSLLFKVYEMNFLKKLEIHY